MDETVKNKKPLGRKNYGSIPHLPGSRRGPGDRGIQGAQADIATTKVPSKHHYVIVQEKLDGSNVGVAKINGEIVALSRSGYAARTSPYKQHHMFADYVEEKWINYYFKCILNEGERMCGEWMAQAHGTRYKIIDPFLAFDIFDKDNVRMPYNEFFGRISDFGIPIVRTIHSHNSALSIESAMKHLGEHGFHGALEKPEGAVWRVEEDVPIGGGERKRVVRFLCKYVHPDKVDGKYLPFISGKDDVWNWKPNET